MIGDPLVPLLRTAAGELREGDRFYFRRTTFTGSAQTGWVTARSVRNNGDRVWIAGTDDRGRARSIRPEEVTRIKHPKPVSVR